MASNPAEELREVARTAAREFLAEEAELEFLGHGGSLTFRARVGRDRAEPRTFLLRVHVPVSDQGPAALPRLEPMPESACDPFAAEASIESECAWLSALSEDTDLVVPRPVRSPAGSFVLQVRRGEAEPSVACTLLNWVEGEPLEGRRTAEQAAALGELLAALHTHARSWTPPPNFVRPELGAARWRAVPPQLAVLAREGLGVPADHEFMARALAVAEAELAPLREPPHRARHIGLIHGDLHAGNYVVQDGRIRPIDFGRAGFGPWLCDVAECMAHLAPGTRRDLLGAYARHHPLEPGDVRRIEGYFAASVIETLGYHARNPAERDYLRQAVPAWAPHVRRYVEGQPFLFEL